MELSDPLEFGGLFDRSATFDGVHEALTGRARA